MFLPTPTPTPVPVVVTSSPGDPWWRITLDVAIAVGTIAAAVVAALAARQAGLIANKDRQAAESRAREERAYERDRQALQHRLDSMVELIESYETSDTIPSNKGSLRHRAQGPFLARLQASPEVLPVLRRRYFDGLALSSIGEIEYYAREYGVAGVTDRGAIERAEMRHTLESIRRQLSET